jgi:hypothetical protein
MAALLFLADKLDFTKSAHYHGCTAVKTSCDDEDWMLDLVRSNILQFAAALVEDLRPLQV